MSEPEGCRVSDDTIKSFKNLLSGIEESFKSQTFVNPGLSSVENLNQIKNNKTVMNVFKEHFLSLNQNIAYMVTKLQSCIKKYKILVDELELSPFKVDDKTKIMYQDTLIDAKKDVFMKYQLIVGIIILLFLAYTFTLTNKNITK